AHGRARLLVSCAGIGTASRTISKNGPFPYELFKRTININLVGTFNVIRLFAERLATAEPIGEERGVIINTASVAAFDGQIGQAAYSAAKGGAVGLSFAVPPDLAAGLIRACRCGPGHLPTPT